MRTADVYRDINHQPLPRHQFAANCSLIAFSSPLHSSFPLFSSFNDTLVLSNTYFIRRKRILITWEQSLQLRLNCGFSGRCVVGGRNCFSSGCCCLSLRRRGLHILINQKSAAAFFNNRRRLYSTGSSAEGTGSGESEMPE